MSCSVSGCNALRLCPKCEEELKRPQKIINWQCFKCFKISPTLMNGYYCEECKEDSQ